MKNILPLSLDRKLTVIIRVEPACLGPNGYDHIEKFCSVTQIKIEPIDSAFINWEIVPRFDKSLPEIQYKVTNKILTHEQAAKYLALFSKRLDAFEGYLNEKLAILIDQHLGH